MVAVKPATIRPVGNKMTHDPYVGWTLQINLHGAQLTASMTIGISLTLVFSITSYTREKWTQSRKSMKIQIILKNISTQ